MRRKTKILATVGPASRDPEVLDALLSAGLDAVRLNFSHGNHAQHAETYGRVREAAARHQSEVAILQDLQGPKIRLGRIDGEIRVAAGARLVITTRGIVGAGEVVPTDHPRLPADVSVGMLILLDEGRVSAIVRSVADQDVVCEVVDGGTLASNKGLSVPGAALTTAAMTEKDRVDVRFGLDLGVDYVALSFVRRANDIHDLRRFMSEHGRIVPIIAKIEKPQAVEAIDEIVAAADGVMVARGDLAIEASLDMIPVHQKKIIGRANRAGKLVVTATQMLESMTDNALPTRAEVTDVANAILDGTDVVMLSGETAVGKHPVEAVRMMASIACTTEEMLYPFDVPVRPTAERDGRLRGVIARIAAQASREAKAKAIVVFTESGDTAAHLSDERPRAAILAFTRNRATLRRLALHFGVQAFPLEGPVSAPELMERAERFVLEEKWAVGGETLVVLLGAEQAPGVDHSVRLLVLAPPRDAK